MRLINEIVKLRDSMKAIKDAMDLAATQTERDYQRSTSNNVFNLSEDIDDLASAYTRLDVRLQHNYKLLTGKDETAAALLRGTFDDEMQCLAFKCRAYLYQIHLKVQQAKLAAVPFERRISQAKKGMMLSNAYSYSS